MTTDSHDVSRRTFLQQSTGAMMGLAFVPSLAAIGSARLGAPLGVAVIGVGRQGRALLGELQKMNNVQIVAMCDLDDRRLNAAARRAPGAKSYADHRELLDKHPEAKAIFVSTPTHLHREIAVHALQAGRHVYCESPLASTIDDARAIVLAARTSGTKFFAGLQGRTNPIYKLAYSFFRTGVIANPVIFRGQNHRKISLRIPANDPARDRALNWPLDPEVSLGLPGEWGTQQFDVIHWYADRYPVKVRGAGDIRLWNDGREVADTIDCEFTFDDGMRFMYDATLANSYEGEYEQFCGSMGTIKLAWTFGWLFKEADAPTQGWEVYANRQQFHRDEGITLIADATQLAAQNRLKDGIGLPNPPLYYAVEDFINAIANDQPVTVSAEEGLRATAVAIAAAKAVRENTEVEIDPAMFRLA